MCMVRAGRTILIQPIYRMSQTKQTALDVNVNRIIKEID